MKLEDHLVAKFLSDDPRNLTAYPDYDWVNLEPDPFLIVKDEFSSCNQRILSNTLKIFNPQVIVEVGVSRTISHTHSDSSTNIFLSQKKDSTIYLGIDIEDKSHLENLSPNTHTIKCKSQDYEMVWKKMKNIGIEKIDFLFLDGNHSVNQVISELWYIDMFMKPGGIIGFHDTNYHPGPSLVTKYLRKDKFVTTLHCTQKEDWGIGFSIII